MLMTIHGPWNAWQGASWNFVLWGVVHGLILIGHRDLGHLRAFERKRLGVPLVQSTGWFITQVLVFLTWLIFRVEDTKMLMEAITGFLFLHGEFDVAAAREVLPQVQHLTTALVVVFILMHGISGRLGRLMIVFPRASGSVGRVRWYQHRRDAVPSSSESSEFIYFRFLRREANVAAPLAPSKGVASASRPSKASNAASRFPTVRTCPRP